MKIIRSIKRYYYRLRLKEAENWIEAKEAGELSDWDNYCTQAEFDYYKNTFDNRLIPPAAGHHALAAALDHRRAGRAAADG